VAQFSVSYSLPHDNCMYVSMPTYIALAAVAKDRNACSTELGAHLITVLIQKDMV